MGIMGHVVQSVTCLTALTADTCLTAALGVASLIPARAHTFAEIDHEIISTAILLPSADSKRVCCQLQASLPLIQKELLSVTCVPSTDSKSCFQLQPSLSLIQRVVVSYKLFESAEGRRMAVEIIS